MATEPTLDLDTELMLQVKDGNEASFETLYAKYHGGVRNLLFRMVQNASIADELAQETFLHAFRARATYVPTARFTTWLFRIATHLALNSRRDGRKEESHARLDLSTPDSPAIQVADKKPNVEQCLMLETRVAEVKDAIMRLPRKQREAVLMHTYEEMYYSEIAEALICSQSAVKSLLCRAYETLRARLLYLETPKPVISNVSDYFFIDTRITSETLAVCIYS